MKTTTTLCDKCENKVAKIKCSMCGCDVCATCSNMLVIDKSKDEMRIRFHKFQYDAELDALADAETIKRALQEKMIDEEGIAKDMSISRAIFCNDCVQRICNSNAAEEIVRAIKDTIMVEEI